MKIINSTAKIERSVSSRLYETYILNPVRMHAKVDSVVHQIVIDMMPDIAKKIESHEKFYKNRETRFDIEPVLLLKEIPNKGYTVCTILIDENSKYDRDMWLRAIRRICNRSSDYATFRLLKESDVISKEDWEYALEVLKTYAHEHDTIELYSDATIEDKNNCQACAHKEVCKYIFMNKTQPECKHFLTI